MIKYINNQKLSYMDENLIVKLNNELKYWGISDIPSKDSPSSSLCENTNPNSVPYDTSYSNSSLSTPRA